MSAFLSLRNASINLSIDISILQPYITTLVISVSQYFFESFRFFLFYWTHARLYLMLCLFATDAFMRDFYFVFITSIYIVSFYTIIAFLDIFAHFFNVIIFVAIETLSYSTFSRTYYRVLFTFFLQKFFCDDSINFFRKFCFYYQRKVCFFQSFHVFRSCHSDDV